MVVVWGFLRDAVVPCRVPALAERCDRMRPRLLRMAASVLRDEHEAEDAVQDALLRAWRGVDRLREPEAFETWLLRVTRNAAIDRLRSRSRDRRLVAGTLDHAPEPVDRSALRLNAFPEFREAVQALPAYQTRVLALDLAGRSLKEIALAEAVSYAAAKTALSRARRRLRRRLGYSSTSK